MSGPWVGVAAPGTHIMGPIATGGGPVNAYPPSRPGEKNMPFWGAAFGGLRSAASRHGADKFPELTAYQSTGSCSRRTIHHCRCGQQTGVRAGGSVAALTFNIPSVMARSAQSRLITPAAPPPPPDHRARNIAIGFVGAVATGVLAMAIGAQLRRAR